MTDPAPTAVRPASFALGEAGPAYVAAVDEARDASWANRLFDGDVTLWSDDPAVGAAISERLGWLDAPEHFTRQVAALEGFGDGIVDAGFTAVVVAGMGGSSLAPDVLHRTFGTQEGYLELRILDSTDPAAVTAVLDDLDPLKTLVVVASKSGTTTEPNAFLAAAWDRADKALDAIDHHTYETPGAVIAAITDPGKSLEAFAHHDDFRDVFLNPPDIGGRYSALTYVGLVPASLIGLDLDALLASALAMLGACREPDPAANPGLSLGLAIGTLAANGRDKLTFLADDEIASFGAWAEQLIAESTGKHGLGIVPVDLEPLGAPGAYGPDRAFVRLALAGSPDGGRDALADELVAAGHPLIRIELSDPMDIGAEFIRWEVATAIAGAVLRIDPFDQPNVEEAKELTRNVLAKAERGQPMTSGAAATRADHDDLVAILAAQLERRAPRAYLALQAFISPTPGRDEAMARIRALLRDRTGNATTAGYGPRFLHSTGQLHKGGAPIGWFLQLIADHPDDREIPGWPYTFGQLIDAQASGDHAAIESHELPILRIHLGADPDAGLAALERALDAALATTSEG
jgi:glucose-6-phosphate isomerase